MSRSKVLILVFTLSLSIGWANTGSFTGQYIGEKCRAQVSCVSTQCQVSLTKYLDLDQRYVDNQLSVKGSFQVSINPNLLRVSNYETINAEMLENNSATVGTQWSGDTAIRVFIFEWNTTTASASNQREIECKKMRKIRSSSVPRPRLPSPR